MAARFLVSGGNGNWSSTTNWSATSGGGSGASAPTSADTVTMDSLSGNANITVDVSSACLSLTMSGTYAGTLTFNAQLSVSGSITFVSTCTLAGTTGPLIPHSGPATLTSAGKTLTCPLTFDNAGTYTLADDWTVNGLVSGTGSAAVNTHTIHCKGGLRSVGAGTIGGTVTLSVEGGTWDHTGSTGFQCNLAIAGNVTISGNVYWSPGAAGRTLTYTSGTVTLTGSTLNVSASTACTFDTHGLTWNNVTLGGSTTYTLNSNLEWSGTLTVSSATTTFSGAGTLSGTGAATFAGSGTYTLNNTGGLQTTGTLTLPNAAVTFAGSAGFTAGTLTTASLSAARTYTLQASNTYTVNTAFNTTGTTSTNRITLKSSTAGTRAIFTVNGTTSASFVDPTDIDSSAGNQVQVGGPITITNTLNWADKGARYLVAGGSGNWSGTNNWSYTSGGTSGVAAPTVAENVFFDSNSGNANIAVDVSSACLSLTVSGTYTGTLTFNNQLAVSGNITFVAGMSLAGTTGPLVIAVSATVTSAGLTIPCPLQFPNISLTLADNWTVTGLVTMTGASGQCILQPSGKTLTANGGVTIAAGSGSFSGTAKLVIAGGTWNQTGTGNYSISAIDLAGNVTVSGTINWTGSTLTYVSGTITTTGSTLGLNSTTTINTAGVTWNNILAGTNVITLSSNLAWSGTITPTLASSASSSWTGAGTLVGPGGFNVGGNTAGNAYILTLNNTGGLNTTGTLTLDNGNFTAAGSSGFTVGTLTNTSYTASRTVTLAAGNTYTVNGNVANVGTTSVNTQSFVSGTPGTRAIFTVKGTTDLFYANGTDMDSSQGNTIFTYHGTLSNDINWTNQFTKFPQSNLAL